MRRTYFIVFVLLIVLLFSCRDRSVDVARDSKPVVTVSILPYKWFVEQIAGDSVDVFVLVGHGQSPHSYQPSPSQLASLSGARLWFLAGVDFENALVEKVMAMYPELKIIDATLGIKPRKVEEYSAEGDEESDGVDRHTWLGRGAALVILRNIYDTLVEEFPDKVSLYKKNYGNLVSEINRVFDELSHRLAPLAGSKVFVFHPSFGYFLDEFSLRQVPVEVGGKEPSASQLADFIELAKKEKPRAVFVQAQFSDRAARLIADSVGAEVLSLDPLAEDWLDNIKRMGSALAAACEGKK
ncbi:zinc ABC transporter substrate-binding protein [Spirochaetia bacterium 38H-sp]|uniref:Zinc ABC transporter substrate-binding protein n=1 Tax=Rarispira pelagica TaxID=3141764 RepID=A0ABU9U8K0_9SPIR